MEVGTDAIGPRIILGGPSFTVYAMAVPDLGILMTTRSKGTPQGYLNLPEVVIEKGHRR